MPGLLQRVLRRRTDEPAPPPAEPDAPTAVQPAVAPEGETGDPEARHAAWLQRGRMRRRLRYLRRARELALRDLGGLVFDLDRFGRERPELVRAKLDALTALDGERRSLETALDDHRDLDVLREPGVASCPRCGALHASDARFCSTCGLPVGPGAALPPGPVAAGEEPASPEPVPGAAAATSDTAAT